MIYKYTFSPSQPFMAKGRKKWMHLHQTWHWKMLLLLRRGSLWLSTLAWIKSSMFNTSTNTPILTELVPRKNTVLFIIWWWISKKAIKWHNIALKSMKRNITQSNFALKTRFLSLKQECLCFWCSAPSCFTLIMWADRSAKRSGKLNSSVYP